MNFREEVLKIFEDHCTAPTRERHLRHRFRMTGEATGTPVHTVVCELFKAKLPEQEEEKRFGALLGIDIQTITPKPKISNEAKAFADEIRAELGLKPKTDIETEERAWLAKAYPSLLGPEPTEYDPLEGLPPGKREICEFFYGSKGTKDFGYLDGYAPESPDPELEEMAQGFYPKMK